MDTDTIDVSTVIVRRLYDAWQESYRTNSNSYVERLLKDPKCKLPQVCKKEAIDTLLMDHVKIEKQKEASKEATYIGISYAALKLAIMHCVQYWKQLNSTNPSILNKLHTTAQIIWTKIIATKKTCKHKAFQALDSDNETIYATKIKHDSNEFQLNPSELEKIDMISLVHILINADAYYVWNIRKRLLLFSWYHRLNGLMYNCAWSRECKLMDTVLRLHPKRGEAWIHRTWLMLRIPIPVADTTKQTICDNTVEQLACGNTVEQTACGNTVEQSPCDNTVEQTIYGNTTDQAADGTMEDCNSTHTTEYIFLSETHRDFLLQQSLLRHSHAIATAATRKYPRNYFAWQHKVMMLPFMHLKLIAEELLHLERDTRMHPEDASLLHFRLQLIQQIYRQFQLTKSSTEYIEQRFCCVIVRELLLNRHCIDLFGCHEALLTCRRNLFRLMLDIAPSDTLLSLQDLSNPNDILGIYGSLCSQLRQDRDGIAWSLYTLTEPTDWLSSDIFKFQSEPRTSVLSNILSIEIMTVLQTLQRGITSQFKMNFQTKPQSVDTLVTNSMSSSTEQPIGHSTGRSTEELAEKSTEQSNEHPAEQSLEHSTDQSPELLTQQSYLTRSFVCATPKHLSAWIGYATSIFHCIEPRLNQFPHEAKEILMQMQSECIRQQQYLVETYQSSAWRFAGNIPIPYLLGKTS